MSRYKCKLCHKVRNGQNLLHESPNFTNYFFQSKFRYNLGHVSTSLRPHYQNSFFLNNFFFSTLNSRMFRNICIWRHKMCNAKTGVGQTFTLSNEPWFTHLFLPTCSEPDITRYHWLISSSQLLSTPQDDQDDQDDQEPSYQSYQVSSQEQLGRVLRTPKS